MASSDQFRSGQIAITGAAQQLTALPKNVAGVVLKNKGGAAIYLGSANTVSTTTGFALDVDETISLDIINPGRLWVIGTAADRLHWAIIGA